MLLKRDGFTLDIANPTIYVDNEARDRSGHMSHAMAEFRKGCFIDFNSNCSSVRYNGHMPYGWVEYRISADSGKTYSDFKTLDYSYKSFIDGIHTISVEKAVACDDGTIVALCLRNDASTPDFCEPWATPTVIRSCDEGKTWSKPMVYSEFPGRTYDAAYHDGVIYVLHFCNPNFIGKTEEHKYRIYKSEDNGETFSELCVVPIDAIGRGYGSMLFDDAGNLHVYAYNINDEIHMDHAISNDNGRSWTGTEPSYLKLGIRNPQTAILDGVFILHGRSADTHGFVIYSSVDGSIWDEGYFIEHVNYKAGAYYSNNLNLEDENGKFLLIQYSSPYPKRMEGDWVGTVNVKHLRLEIVR